MKTSTAPHPKTTQWDELKADYEKRILLRDEEIAILREQIKSLKDHLFGVKSEKLHHEVVALQPSLFELEQLEDLEEEHPCDDDDKKETVIHRKKSRGRKKLPDWLPRDQVIHDLPEEDKLCQCGCLRTQIGADRCEVLEKVPAQLHVIEHVRLKYACKNPDCAIALEGKPGAVQIAPAPSRMIPKSLAGHSLLAHVLNAKFTDWLPFYRVEKQLRREHVHIPRQTMSRWAMKVASALKPMWTLMLADVKTHPYLQMDETTVQVLKEPGRKNTSNSYMWVIRGGPPDRPIVLYKYHPSRAAHVARDLLGGFTGVVQTDGYEGYSFLDRENSDFIHAGCLVHARRKFTAIVKTAGKHRKKGYTDKVLVLFKKLYRIERLAKAEGLGLQELVERRQRDSKPMMEKLHRLLLEIHGRTPPAGMLGIAVAYTLKQWPKLGVFLNNGLIKLDTNDVENAIRPFVCGRKAWMFSGHPDGAQASAILYSMVETALCRARHRAVYADRRTMPNAPDCRLRKRPVPGFCGNGRFGNIRHSLGVIARSGTQADGRWDEIGLPCLSAVA